MYVDHRFRTRNNVVWGQPLQEIHRKQMDSRLKKACINFIISCIFRNFFFCHEFLGFLCISCKGCPQTILFLVRNRWSRYLPGSFRMSEQLNCSFYFMSCLCRHMVGLHTFASVVLHRSACGSRPLVQTFLQTFP